MNSIGSAVCARATTKLSRVARARQGGYPLGQFASESLVSLEWNGWSVYSGISGQFAPEYALHDRFFAFWFKYVLPNRGRLELGNEGYVLKQIKDTLDLHVSKSYESISREIFLDMAKRKDISITSLGRWWSKNEEIDLVALDEENKTIWFGECKWSGKKVGTDVYQDLRRKSELVEWHAGRRNERFILFSRSGFTPAMLDLAKREKVVLAEGESTHR